MGKAGGTSASSFFDLKAQLSKREEEFSRTKSSGKSTSTLGGVKRPDKKPTVWARQNKGVQSRGKRDIELEAISVPTLESARAALERKAKIYDKLRKGKTGGLSDKQYDMLLVDFDQQNGDVYESDSDDVDESLAVPRGPVDEQDDPIVEYEDEFGRIRTGRRSEIPRNLAPLSGTDEAEGDDDVIYNPVNHFPVYEPSAERVAEIAEAHSEANNPLGVHYDATQEVRAKGAGFYQFSGDEETRRQQMEELKAAREETEKTRKETGAVTLKPGEVEGMRDEGNATTAAAAGVKSRAMEKRRLELEERRRMVDAKRRKVDAGGVQIPAPVGNQHADLSSVKTGLDPFASLEAKTAGVKDKDKPVSKPSITSEADAFLAQLEHDILVCIPRASHRE